MKKMSSSDAQHHNVTLHHAEHGVLGEGVLSLRENHWASVTVDRSFARNFIHEKRIDLVKAVVTKSGRTYSLCKCKLNGHTLYADYFIEADIEVAEFDRIVVRYSDISEWFLRWQSIEGETGKQLTWSRLSAPLSVSVSTDQEAFTLESEYIGTRESRGEDVILHEHIEFILSSTDKKFAPDDVKKKTLELSCLLSILITYPVTIMSIHVGVSQGNLRKIHFPTFERPERDVEDSGFWIRHFIQKSKIEDRWQTIFDGYYRSKYRKECWIRLSGMQRYDGFWEYEALGYISLLDRYVSLRCKDSFKPVKEPPSEKKMAAFQRSLSGITPSLSEDQSNRLCQIAYQAFSSKPEFTFVQKYNLTVAETDPDVIRIIALSADDFHLIKRIRDKIAHGAEHGLRDDDCTRVSEVVSKIVLLLTYWFFLDLGLTNEDFIDSLKLTHSYRRRAAKLDEVYLDRVTKSAEFYSVSKEKLEMLRNTKGVRLSACFLLDRDGKLQFSEKYTSAYQDWKRSPSREYGYLKASTIFGISDDAARMVGRGYFECDEDEDRMELYNFWIIDGSKITEPDAPPPLSL